MSKKNRLSCLLFLAVVWVVVIASVGTKAYQSLVVYEESQVQAEYRERNRDMLADFNARTDAYYTTP